MSEADSVVRTCAFLSDIRIWDATLKTAARRWMTNFNEDEQQHAAALLDAFLFFSDDLVNRLFVAGFDALATEVTAQATTYAEKKRVWQKFRDEVLITHPTGEMPNVTDSGYAFARRARQRLGIDQAHILETSDVLPMVAGNSSRTVLFVDDFVGSGDQFCNTWHRSYATAQGQLSFAALAARKDSPTFYYSPLICTEAGFTIIRNNCPGVQVRPTHLLPSVYSANHAQSILWPDALRDGGIGYVETSSTRAGISATKRWGYHNLGLALAFEHGVPDATLPILWWEEAGWIPLVRRR